MMKKANTKDKSVLWDRYLWGIGGLLVVIVLLSLFVDGFIEKSVESTNRVSLIFILLNLFGIAGSLVGLLGGSLSGKKKIIVALCCLVFVYLCGVNIYTYMFSDPAINILG